MIDVGETRAEKSRQTHLSKQREIKDSDIHLAWHGNCHSLVQQNSRNIIDGIIIFHLTTDMRSDADVPTVFFRFRFVAIFLLVRFLLAIVDVLEATALLLLLLLRLLYRRCLGWVWVRRIEPLLLWLS